MNQFAGTRLQLIITRFLLIFVVGPLAWTLARLFFRIRVEGAEKVASMPRSGILAVRHFYEWDPFLYWGAFLWAQAARDHRFTAHPMAGAFWAQNAIFRAISTLCGILPFVPGREPFNGALGAAERILRGPYADTVVIFPTGPIGRSRQYHMRYGVGWLGERLPEVPIYPVTLLGLQEVRWSEVLRLRRPLLTVRIAEPIHGSAADAEERQARERQICAAICGAWDLMETVAVPAAEPSKRPAAGPDNDEPTATAPSATLLRFPIRRSSQCNIGMGPLRFGT
jgi:1-acyl-sn-glycerol-3-phosphate acyltransferase